MTDPAATGRGGSRALGQRGTASAEEPMFLNVEEVADLLRTTKRAIYLMIARGQLAGVRHIGRRVLVNRAELLHSLNHKCAPSDRSHR